MVASIDENKNSHWKIKITKRVHTFPKADIIVRLVFKLTYDDIAVQSVNHYAMVTPPQHIDFNTF